MRLLWKEKVAEAVLELLRDTRIGCRPAVIARIEPPVEEEGMTVKAERVGVAVKAKVVGQDRSGVYGLFICFPPFFCYSTRHFFFRLSLSFVTLSLLPFPSHMFPSICFSILRFWDAGLRRSRSPARAGRARRGQEMVT